MGSLVLLDLMGGVAAGELAAHRSAETDLATLPAPVHGRP